MSYRSSTRIGANRGYGLMLVALLVVLVPSICLVWFMNRAVQNERAAVRQKLFEAYRGNLALAQDRLETRLRAWVADLEASPATLAPSALFAREVTSGRADAIILLEATGNLLYPGPARVERPPHSEEWTAAETIELTDPARAADAFARLARGDDPTLAARASQAQARCLLHDNRKDAAHAVLADLSQNERFRDITDLQGRLIAANATLMLLESLPGVDSSEGSMLLDRLAGQIDYSNAAMPASQRRFLLREFCKHRPNDPHAALLAAEDLATAFLENSSSHPTRSEPVFRPAQQTDVWQFCSENGLAITLHRSSRLADRLEQWLSPENLPADLSLHVKPPGSEPGKFFASIGAGPVLPGWQLGLSFKEQRPFVAAAGQGVGSYVWIGTLVLVTVGVLAALMLHLVRRQLTLNQLRTDLVANVSHELKTPLSSMRLLVETLLDAETLEGSTAREYLQLISNENQRLSRLIDNFLTFSRIERNKYQFTFQPVEAATVIAAASEAVRERFNVPGCRFEVQPPPPRAEFIGDADAVVTALVNLLDNAWKYSGDDKLISLGAAAQNGSIVFSVRDNGAGIPARDLNRIFKRFYQVDRRLSRSGSGCGLGLSIVQFVMQAHKGKVEVESQPGTGSLFKLSVPATKSHEG